MSVSTPNTLVWLSVYLYPKVTLDSALMEIGHLIAQVKAEIAPELNWFFIRYHDRLGPHLRLRVQCANHEMRSAIVSKLEHVFGLPGLADSHRRRGVTSSGLLLRARQVRYRPEISRYGGHARIAFSERFFQSSSEWVLQYVNLLGVEYPRRLLTAGVSGYLFLRVASRGMAGAAQMASVTATGWVYTLRKRLVYVDEAGMAARWLQDQAGWSRCFSLAERNLGPEGLESPLCEWVSECRARIEELDRSFRAEAPQRLRVIQSWIHMHFNRMGITVADEALILFCLTRYFEVKDAT